MRISEGMRENASMTQNSFMRQSGPRYPYGGWCCVMNRGRHYPQSGMQIYILLGLNVQPQLQKVQTQCERLHPQLGRGPFVGLRWSAVSLRGKSFDIKKTFHRPERALLVREALCRPERVLVGLKRPSFGLRRPSFGLRGPCVGLKDPCFDLRRAL